MFAGFFNRFICTCFLKNKKIKKELTDLGLSVIDTFSCKGFDTYGPWKLIGGLAKKHPNENDFANYSLFIKNLQIKE